MCCGEGSSVCYEILNKNKKDFILLKSTVFLWEFCTVDVFNVM